MKKIILVTALSLTALASFGQNKGEFYSQSTEKVSLQDVFKEIELGELPKAIKAMVIKYYPTATIEKVFVNELGQYKLVMSLKDGTKGSLFTDDQGNWLDI